MVRIIERQAVEDNVVLRVVTPDLPGLVAIDDLHQEIGGLGKKLARAVEDAEAQCAGVGHGSPQWTETTIASARAMTEARTFAKKWRATGECQAWAFASALVASDWAAVAMAIPSCSISDIRFQFD